MTTNISRLVKVGFEPAGKWWLSALIISLLAGCGGGSSSSTPTSSASSNIGPFTKYQGSWVQPCQNHFLQTSTLTPSNGGTTLSIAIENEIFNNADCTGAVVATGTYNQPTVISMQYAATVPNATVQMLTGAPITASVDTAMATGIAATMSYTGSGVTSSSVVNGNTVWHIVYTNGYDDQTTDNIISGTAQGALLLLNNSFYMLLPVSGSTTLFQVENQYAPAP